MPDGYDTLIGEGGVNLSGGKRQRLAIARCMLRDSPIILFDEMTSTLDNATQAEIQAAIDNMSHGRTRASDSVFDATMDPENPTDAFLIEAVDYCVNDLKLDKDGLLKELVDAIIGGYHPTLSRCLTNTETILNAFL